MATKSDPRKQTPFQPVTQANNFKGKTDLQREMTGKNASVDSQYTWDKVAAQFDPQQTALHSALTRAKQDQAQQTDQLDKFGDKYGSRLGEISDLLNSQMSDSTGRISGLYGDAQNSVAGAYGAAANASQGASGEVKDSLTALMERLGLQEAGRDPMAQLSQTQQDNMGRNSQSQAGAVGNFANLGADMTAISEKAGMDQRQEWAGKQSDLGTMVIQGIKGINDDYNAKRDELQSQFQAIAGARGEAMATTLIDTINERLERERQGRLDELAEEMAKRGMAVQEGSLDIQRGYLGLGQDRLGLDTELGRGNLDVARGGLDIQKGNLALQREQLNMQKEQAQAAIEAASSPTALLQAQLDMQKIEAEIRNLDSQTAGNFADASGGGADGGRYTGIQGARNWVTEASGLSPSAQSGLTSEFENLVTSAYDIEARTGQTVNSAMMQEANAHPNPAIRKALQEMVHIAIGNHADYAE